MTTKKNKINIIKGASRPLRSRGLLGSVILNEATGPNWCDFQMRHYDVQPVTVVRPVVAHLNQNDTGHAARPARAKGLVRSEMARGHLQPSPAAAAGNGRSRRSRRGRADQCSSCRQ